VLSPVSHVLIGGVAGLGGARRFITTTLEEWRFAPDLIDAVGIVATELLTNAIVHAASEPVMGLDPDGGTLVLRVLDTSQRPPAPRARHTCDGHGFGLRIVEALSDGWGYEHYDFGKVVWARFRPPPA